MAMQRFHRSDRWEDGTTEFEGSEAFKPLSKEQAQALRAKNPSLSPWRVIGVQAAVGAVAALLSALLMQRPEVGWSMLYGAATVVVPGALLARGMTRSLKSQSAIGSAVSFLSWEMVKIAFSVAMLLLAPRIVQPLSWPALLVGLVLCIKVYWLALAWRQRR